MEIAVLVLEDFLQQQEERKVKFEKNIDEGNYANDRQRQVYEKALINLDEAISEVKEAISILNTKIHYEDK